MNGHERMLTFTVRKVIRGVVVNVSSDPSTFSSRNILGSPASRNIPLPFELVVGFEAHVGQLV